MGYFSTVRWVSQGKRIGVGGKGKRVGVSAGGVSALGRRESVGVKGKGSVSGVWAYERPA
jgi:hypothetical protein